MTTRLRIDEWRPCCYRVRPPDAPARPFTGAAHTDHRLPVSTPRRPPRALAARNFDEWRRPHSAHSSSAPRPDRLTLGRATPRARRAVEMLACPVAPR